MPTSTTATKAKATGSRGSAKPSAGASPKADRVTAADAVILGDGFGKVNRSEVPREALAKGDRDNPYDAVMKVSFEDNDESTDDWRSVKTNTDAVDKQCKLIRNAAHFLNVGSRISKPQDNGDGTSTIWFRAQELRKKGPRKSNTDETPTVSE